MDNQYYTIFPVMCCLNDDFELIEDNNIDIDSIEEKEWYGSQEKDTKINELIQAVKQLNREIKELKEKTND